MSDWFNPDPGTHHPFCSFVRYGDECSCFEGKFPSGPEADALIQQVYDGKLTGTEALARAREVQA